MSIKTPYDGLVMDEHKELILITQSDRDCVEHFYLTQNLAERDRTLSACVIDFKTTKSDSLDNYEVDWASLEIPTSWNIRLPTRQNRLATIAILAHFAKGHLFTRGSGR